MEPIPPRYFLSSYVVKMPYIYIFLVWQGTLFTELVSRAESNNLGCNLLSVRHSKSIIIVILRSSGGANHGPSLMVSRLCRYSEILSICSVPAAVAVRDIHEDDEHPAIKLELYVWYYLMRNFSVLLALDSPHKEPVMQNLRDCFFVSLNKPLNIKSLCQ